MNIRIPQRSKHNVNLWIVPLKMSAGAVGLFAITMAPDMLAAYHIIHLPDWFSMGGIDDARAILSAMMGCVSTVLALIFSVALLVLSMVANLFGPRLLYRFVQDWVTQFCIGIFMGAFIYVFLVFLVTHQDGHSTFIPQVSLITSWFLVLFAFAFLVFYSHRVAVLIQNPDAIGRIVDDLRVGIHKQSAIFTEELPFATERAPRPTISEGDFSWVYNQQSGYLQDIDHVTLIAAAAKAGAQVSFAFRPGQFMLQGETLAVITPASAGPSLEPAVRRCVSMGRHRVLSQDLEFGLAQIVEVAIRALSPAVNDTFTGVACVDLLGEALTALARAPQWSGRSFDKDGVVRVRVPPLLLPRLVKQAFDQIRQAAADNPAVSIRILATLGRLAPNFLDQAAQTALLDQVEAVWETASPKTLSAMDLADLDFAHRQATERIRKLSDPLVLSSSH